MIDGIEDFKPAEKPTPEQIEKFKALRTAIETQSADEAGLLHELKALYGKDIMPVFNQWRREEFIIVARTPFSVLSTEQAPGYLPAFKASTSPNSSSLRTPTPRPEAPIEETRKKKSGSGCCTLV